VTNRDCALAKRSYLSRRVEYCIPQLRVRCGEPFVPATLVEGTLSDTSAHRHGIPSGRIVLRPAGTRVHTVASTGAGLSERALGRRACAATRERAPPAGSVA